jgi:cell division transport system permease protein
MALNVRYVARETGTNLRRNFSLTLASVVTVAVSLTLFGAALVFAQGVGNMTARWKGGIEFIVFMQPSATQEQLDSVKGALEQNPEVRSVTYIDKAAAYEEFKQLFSRSRDMIEAVDQEAMPPSFRVAPSNSDADVVQALGTEFQKKAGVREVVFAFDTVKTMQRVTRIASFVIVAVAVFLLLAAVLLILNTIRMAMFARRREIEVMKLVGATNWFIRVPFMVEGLVQGIIGAAVAIIGVQGLNWAFDRGLSGNEDLRIFQGFVITGGQMSFTTLLLIGLGCLIGALGSGIAVSRFLDV